MSENLMNSANSQNDEIDIFELLGKIWKGKFSIAMFVLAFFALGVLYTIIATPWYSAKARISVPYYKDAYEKDDPEIKYYLNHTNIIMQEFKDSSTDGNTYVKNVSYAKINGNILWEYFDVEVYATSAEAATDFIKQAVGKIGEKYNKQMDKIIKTKKDRLNDIDNAIEMLNKNILLIEDDIKNIENISLAKINAMLDDNNTKADYVSLMTAKDTIINVTLPNLKDKVQNIVINEIPNLKNDKERLKLELEPSNYSYIEISNLSISKNPVKPKKLLIVAIATFLGGVLGVLLILLKITIQNIKNRI
ncbi:Wzz/FepE/Etk N-terminal domain-containing protein [Campylobacter sp. JMF_02 ED1]|uniref:Wzz/FepE/Etk N-terminal domain-containing protein n=1 Tax=unclassified Campylobacter TaxID=2593542 RepID=UPI0022EA0A3A|nr:MULTISPECIES: Wzz/FepE/Etk N-terminal domain-containing protein [unclassified Campylobacter]MDA3048779.1 Wzz/FepE/Etk N-terminal domain-containing protein [Campylobacter sp. JMF_15 NE4]MDA3050509.1 Wzz/FepE/Etk N-terminal domain-containing protein [Campylobacter sp. JMF_02 ED1]